MVNVRAVERDQQWLMPPSLRDWLPEDHLAWFVVEVVAALDLAPFYQRLRQDGRGGESYDPALMLGVLFYAYCRGERSSRRIERRLVEDVGFRVVAANQSPDHATLARFRRRHEEAIASLFSQVLGLCVGEGLVSSGVIAIDGTKLEANAGMEANRTHRQLAQEILEEAERIDAAEDRLWGERRGDELPTRWADRSDRPRRLREALRQLEAGGPSDPETYQAARAVKEAERGGKLRGPKPKPERKRGRGRVRQANVTDPDSRLLKAGRRFLQGYNAQAAVSEDQIVVAAEMSNTTRDSTVFPQMVTAVGENLAAVGGSQPQQVVADAGYWDSANATLEAGMEILIPPVSYPGDTDSEQRTERGRVLDRLDRGEIDLPQAATEIGVSPPWVSQLLAQRRRGAANRSQIRAQMRDRLGTEKGTAAYAKRQTMVEPVFGNLKANLGFRRFSGRGFAAATSEWRLICTVHNLLKLHRHRLVLNY